MKIDENTRWLYPNIFDVAYKVFKIHISAQAAKSTLIADTFAYMPIHIFITLLSG